MFRYPFTASEIFQTELNTIFEKFFEKPEDPVIPEPTLEPSESTEASKICELSASSDEENQAPPVKHED